MTNLICVTQNVPIAEEVNTFGTRIAENEFLYVCMYLYSLRQFSHY